MWRGFRVEYLAKPWSAVPWCRLFLDPIGDLGVLDLTGCAAAYFMRGSVALQNQESGGPRRTWAARIGIPETDPVTRPHTPHPIP